MLAARCPNAKFVHTNSLFHGKKLIFSCCLVCISMTRAFQCQYALENKVCIQTSGAWRWHTVPPVYRLPMPQGSLRKAGIPAYNATGKFDKAGIPASDVLRVKPSELFLQNVFAVVDLYGPIESVTITSREDTSTSASPLDNQLDSKLDTTLSQASDNANRTLIL